MGRLWAPTVGGAREPAASQVIFITEYVSSGSLKQFLKKTKKNHKAMNARVQGVGWVSVRDRVGSGCTGDRGGEGVLGGPGHRSGAGPGHLGPSCLSCAHPTESVRRQAWKRWCTQILSALR